MEKNLTEAEMLHHLLKGKSDTASAAAYNIISGFPSVSDTVVNFLLSIHTKYSRFIFQNTKAQRLIFGNIALEEQRCFIKWRCKFFKMPFDDEDN